MIKRNIQESVKEVPGSKELIVPVSKTPAVRKSIWDIDPAPLEDDEDLKRKSPEAKYLKVVSAFITVMVLWGIFWQVRNHLLPQIFSSFGVASPEESFTLAQVRSNAYASQGDSSANLVSSVGDRRAAANLFLEVHVEQVPEKQKETDEPFWEGSLGPARGPAVLHRKLLSDFDHFTTNGICSICGPRLKYPCCSSSHVL